MKKIKLKKALLGLLTSSIVLTSTGCGRLVDLDSESNDTKANCRHISFMLDGELVEFSDCNGDKFNAYPFTEGSFIKVELYNDEDLKIIDGYFDDCTYYKVNHNYDELISNHEVNREYKKIK